MQAHIFTLHAPSAPGVVGSKGQNIFFSESSHDAYQIEGNGAYSNTQTHVLSLNTPVAPGVGSKGQIINFSESNHAAYQIERIMEFRASRKHIYCPYIQPQPVGQFKM